MLGERRASSHIQCGAGTPARVVPRISAVRIRTTPNGAADLPRSLKRLSGYVLGGRHRSRYTFQPKPCSCCTRRSCRHPATSLQKNLPERDIPRYAGPDAYSVGRALHSPYSQASWALLASGCCRLCTPAALRPGAHCSPRELVAQAAARPEVETRVSSLSRRLPCFRPQVRGSRRR